MDTLEKLLELDEKHDKLLEQLAQLDARISETLNEWVTGTAQEVASVPERIFNPKSRIKAA